MFFCYEIYIEKVNDMKHQIFFHLPESQRSFILKFQIKFFFKFQMLYKKGRNWITILISIRIGQADWPFLATWTDSLSICNQQSVLITVFSFVTYLNKFMKNIKSGCFQYYFGLTNGWIRGFTLTRKLST
jgi:hypothetical protein